MMIMDFVTESSYQSDLGNDYKITKGVADFLVTLHGSHVSTVTQQSLFILPTAMTSRVVANGHDVGGDLDAAAALQIARDSGLVLGLNNIPYSLELIESVGIAPEPQVGAAPVVIPDSFNWEVAYPAAVYDTDNKNQAAANNCWARSSSKSISYRLYQAFGASVGQSATQISAHHVTVCSGLPNGCAPQYPSTGFSAMTGDIPTTQCMPEVDTTSVAPPCSSRCTGSGSLSIVNGIVPGSYTRWTTVADVKRELYVNGPMACAMDLPSDFFQVFPQNKFVSTVYNPTNPSPIVGGHMITLVAYTPTTMTFLNSYGVKWGNNGRFELAINNPLYENAIRWPVKNCYTGTPRLGSVNPVKSQPTVTVVDPINNVVVNVPVEPVQPTINSGCDKMVVNATQSINQAKKNGCPANVKKTTTTKKNKKGNGGEYAKPSLFLLMITMTTVVSLLSSF
jgi:hypothetical protein